MSAMGLTTWHLDGFVVAQIRLVILYFELVEVTE